MILFKEPDKQREFAEIHPNLRKKVYVLESIARYYGEVLVVTSMFRDDDNSVHRYGRGIDLAMWRLALPSQEIIRKGFNIVFPYGKQGVETVPPFNHGTAPHWHLQERG